MSLFKKPKVPSLDTAALERIRQASEQQQRQVVGGLTPRLGATTQDFERRRQALSTRIPQESEQILGQFGQDVANINAADLAAANQAAVAQREQAFREVPELQRSIREALGATGRSGNVAAAARVADPLLQAARSARDFTGRLTTERLGREADRAGTVAQTGLQTRQRALQERLGLDEGTINMLTSMGREDLIREADALLGIEREAGQGRLDLELARQANEIERAKASAARRSGILSSLGSLAGMGAGAIAGGGNPLAIGLGGQLGGMLGGTASGGTPQPIDPTLLISLLNRQPRTAIVSGRSVPVR